MNTTFNRTDIEALLSELGRRLASKNLHGESVSMTSPRQDSARHYGPAE
ncbi:MAG: hypothetical protein LBH13_00790 [Cellulomonadaceae bacterium]|jgi:hypothetical protein|nr:hypothetical protein [Cellulomonadaceae bacterium]